MIRLLKMLKPYKFYVFMAPLLMFIEVVVDVYLPKMMSDIIDNKIPDSILTGDISPIIRSGGIMILLSLIGLLGGLGCICFSSMASLNFATDLRYCLFNKVQAFSFANLDKFKTSSLVTRLTNDVTQIQNVVLMGLRLMVRSPLLFVGGIFMASTINLRLTLILVFSVPVLAIALVLVIKKGFPLFKLVQKKLDNVNIVMRENLSGVRVVKAFVREEQEIGKFNKASEDLMNTSIYAFKIILLVFPVMMTIMNVSIIAVLWFGAKQVSLNVIKVGDIIAFIQYMTQILIALMLFSMVLMMISRSKASTDRVIEVLDSDIDIIDPVNAVDFNVHKWDIEFKNVSFSYKDSTGDPILSNISFTAEQGKTLAILGATGSGKTTLVNLIPRLYDATEGTVLIGGIDVRSLKLKDLRDKIGVVLQESILFSGSIIDNVRWGKEDATLEEVEQACKIACAYDFIMDMPDKFGTRLEQKATNLSGGQKQRLSIARALVKKPAVLILDDSTSAVDMATDAKIQKALKEDYYDCTKIIIAQRITSIIEADKIVVLNGGEIVGCGTHDELMASNEIYNDIYHSQIKE